MLMSNLQRKLAKESCHILDNLVYDGATTGPNGNVLRLYRSLTDPQRALMLVDL